MINNNDPWGRKKSNDQRNFGMFGSSNKLSGISKIIFDKMNNMSNNGPNIFIGLVLLVAFTIYMVSNGFYIVKSNQNAVVLRFGTYNRTTTPGLHYRLPYPLENVYLVDVTDVHHVEIGYRTQKVYKSDENEAELLRASNTTRVLAKVVNESLMLAGDESFAMVTFDVQWQVSDPVKYLFNLNDNGIETVKSAAESAMREFIGSNTVEHLIEGTGREAAASYTKQMLQEIMNMYNAGIGILSVQMKAVDPPAQVVDSFREVQSARADKESTINTANAYLNEVIPEARGQYQSIIKNAEAYKQKIINEAQGDIARFNAIYLQYSQHPNITASRIYLDSMESVLSNIGKKIVIDNNSNNLLVTNLSDIIGGLDNAKMTKIK